jgi:dolichol-phosphate mannosyltransferase
MKNNRLLIVIPTYNEVLNIGPLMSEILEEIPTSHIFVVDDGSPDATFSICQEFASVDSRVIAINRGRKLGLASAFLEGFDYALKNDFGLIAIMDADFSHRVKDLQLMFMQIASDSKLEVVLGSRWIKGGSVKNWNWSRVALSKLANLYARNLLSLPMRDATAGFRIFSADFLRKLRFEDFESGGFCFHIEMSHKIAIQGATLLEVPIVFSERVNGASKMSLKIASESFILVTKWGLRRFT